MSFMRVGLGAIPRTIRQPVTRLRIPIMVRKRGMGDTACGPGLVMDNRTDPPHCILEAYAYKLPTQNTAVNFPQAPGCNVVDLSRNACLLDDGTEYGCNGIQECDPLTGAVHYQYALPGGPVSGQPSALKTLGVNLTSVPVNNAAMAPNLSLKNPTSGYYVCCDESIADSEERGHNVRQDCQRSIQGGGTSRPIAKRWNECFRRFRFFLVICCRFIGFVSKFPD